MSLRLILFVIALAVIAWIVWDHNNKNKKRNAYRSNKKPDAWSLGFISAPKPAKKIKNNLAEDIDREVSTSRRSPIAQTRLDDEFDDPELFEDPAVFNKPVTRKVIVDPFVDPDLADDENSDFYMSDEEKDTAMAARAGVVRHAVENQEIEQDAFDDAFDDPFADPYNNPFADPEVTQRNFKTPSSAAMSQDPFVGMTSRNVAKPDSTSNNKTSMNAQPVQQQVNKTHQQATSKPLEAKSTSNMEMDAVEHKVFTIFVSAKDGETFNGDDLLQVLLSLGCRYGKMNIFHRHEQTSGQGRVLFSIASMIKPGTFDINNMQATRIPGIALFFTYPGTQSPLMVFDLMLKTAYRLAKHLNADILDENRELLTTATTAEMRDYIELIEIKEFF